MSVRLHATVSSVLPREFSFSVPAPHHADTAHGARTNLSARTLTHAHGHHQQHRSTQVGPSTVTERELEEAAQKLTDAVSYVNKGIQFRIHEGTERLMVHIIDRVTQEVIKEIPPEEFLDVVANIQEYLGLLFDQRV